MNAGFSYVVHAQKRIISFALHLIMMNAEFTRLKQLQSEINERRAEDWRLMDPTKLMVMLSEIGSALDDLLALVDAADTLAIHVSGLLALKGVSTPANTTHWLENYMKARKRLGDLKTP